MAVVNVVAEMDGTEYSLSEVNGTYESNLTAPQMSTEISVTATDDAGNSQTVSQQLYVGTEWLPPKIDWIASDYFAAIDYNRIIGNLAYLKAYADTLFLSLTNTTLGEEKTRISPIYAREINNIEESLEILNLETYGLDIGPKQTFKPNQPGILWSELNRIESATLLLYETMMAHKNALPRLAFTLGGQKGIKV